VTTLILQKNSVGAGINFNPSGVAGKVAYQRDRLEINTTLGTSWKRHWYAGVTANWKF